MKSKSIILALLCALVLSATALHAQNKPIPAGSKVFVAPMPDGFDTYLKEALAAKKVPLVVVPSREEAEYEITGVSETQKAGAAKKIVMWDWHSNEQASIRVADLRTSEVVFAYSVNKKSSAHGKRSTAEACAKHLKDDVKAASK